MRKIATFAITAFALSCAMLAQESLDHAPYNGVRQWIDGAHFMPAPNMPFSAKANIENTNTLSDGTTIAKKTINAIARDSSGRTRQEGRQLIAASDNSEPKIFYYAIIDPAARARTVVYPAQHLARVFHFSGPLPTTYPPPHPAPAGVVDSKVDLGDTTIEGLPVHGTREIHSYGTGVVGNDKAFDVTDEFWYSPALQMNLLVKHSDPRTGSQTVRITELSRTEPDPSLFEVPADFRKIDEPGPTGAQSMAARGISPPRRISGSEPLYTEEARRAQIQGTVLLRVQVGEDGTVHDVSVVRPLDPGLDQAAADAVRAWRFEPATKDGIPVSVQIGVTVSFHLGGRRP